MEAAGALNATDQLLSTRPVRKDGLADITMSSFDTWLDGLTERVRDKAQLSKYSAVVNDCGDHRGADFCTACGEEVDEDGNTESLTRYCSRHCGCHGTGCPMGLERVE